MTRENEIVDDAPRTVAEPLHADAEQIAAFANAIFRHRPSYGVVNLAAYPHERSRPRLSSVPVLMQGIDSDFSRLIADATRLATGAANAGYPAVFGSPLAIFQRPEDTNRENLTSGLAITVDVDESNSTLALHRLEAIIGPATVVVNSGSDWTDPDTGDVIPKRHLHWRLTKPTYTPEDHTNLREARELASLIVGADMNLASIVHHVRWPGSWHMKAEPRMARIDVLNDDAEIDLTDALDKLRAAAAAAGLSVAAFDSRGAATGAEYEAAPLGLVASALAAVPNPDVDYKSWRNIGLACARVSGGSEDGWKIFSEWSQKSSSKYNGRKALSEWRGMCRSVAKAAGTNHQIITERSIFHHAKAAGWSFADAIEDIIAATEPTHVADKFTALMLACHTADVDPVAEASLVKQAAARAGVGLRPMQQKLKAARNERKQRRAKAARDQHAEADPRAKLPAPSYEAEKLPVVMAIDRILAGLDMPEPPMRDIDGNPIYIRCRAPSMIHQLTSIGVNEGDTKATRIPAPEMALLTRHTMVSLAHEIERCIEFVKTDAKGVKSVGLPHMFIESFAGYVGSALPRVSAIVTSPLVLPNGTLLAPVGLDKKLGIVFRIDPALIDLLPKVEECDAAAVADAMDFLANDWLCDVTTTFAGKCVIISLVMSIIERVLLPERPGFIVTAGQRGGGKTTLLKMAALVATGGGVAAAGWSYSEEERKKAALAYLSDGLPFIVWDNIARGTAIRSATIEKILTAETYTDRRLGQNDSMPEVPCNTIMAFTGNNITAEGDMASRSLPIVLDVDRPDPENREFKHPNPVAWTLDNRGKLLRAIYTILLGNPRLRQPVADREPAKTRFKVWWNLIGSAIEHAADLLAKKEREMVDALVMDAPAVPASIVDFGMMILEAEVDSEESIGHAQVLEAMVMTWQDKSFTASDIEFEVRKRAADFDGGEPRKATPAEHSIDVLTTYFRTASKLRPDHPAPTAMMITKALSNMVGSPVRVKDQIMRLEKQTDRKKGNFFWVKVTDGVCG